MLLDGSGAPPFRPPFKSDGLRADLAACTEGSFWEVDFCALILGACEADSEGAIDGVLLLDRAGGDAAREMMGSSASDSGSGGYAPRLVF